MKQPPESVYLDGNPLERRYLALTSLATGLGACLDWPQLAATVSRSLGDERAPLPTRLWGNTPEGPVELARHPEGEMDVTSPSQEELRAAADQVDPAFDTTGSSLVALHSDGLSLGVLEIAGGLVDSELLAHAAPIIACRFSLLANQGVGSVPITAHSLESITDLGTVMAEFATEAKRLLSHDRLSAYLLTPDGRAFERFAVAGSPLVEGEGVLIAYNEVGLRHVIEMNEALVSSDLAADPRIGGREDRVIARAGYHGLISVPLRHEGRPFGVLNFVSKHPSFYSQEDIPIAEQIAAQIGAFVQNLRVQRRIRTSVRQQAAEDERARISRDLYQTVSESVSSIVELSSELRDGVNPNDKVSRERADRIAEIAVQELAETRRAVADLTPKALDLRSLPDLITASAEKLRRQGIETRLEMTDNLDSLPNSVRRGLYRIIQEALNNVQMHAGAGSVSITVNVDRDLDLKIDDDGQGFDPDAPHSGLGIFHMRDRAEALGGFLTVEAAPGRGTTVIFSLTSVRDRVRRQPGPSIESSHLALPAIRVLVVEPQSLARAGLVRLLDTTDGIRVVGEAAGIDPVPRQLRQFHPDVTVIAGDLAPAEISPLVAEIRRISPSSAILVIGELEIEVETELIADGVGGVVSPTVVSEDLVRAIRAVSGGARLAGSGTGDESSGNRGSVLGKRERAILALVAAGETNAEIGKSLFLATKTVERQVATITRKLDARNRAHAAAIAVSRKFVPPPKSGSQRPK